MRRNPTWAELRLWLALRNNTMGLRFRRQEPIGPYIVDFVCLKRKVIVEADGYSHTFDDGGHGERRDRWLTGQGFTVLHFDDDYIYRHLAEAMADIRRALDANV
jgi:very-short-patch-repair endonuclease